MRPTAWSIRFWYGVGYGFFSLFLLFFYSFRFFGQHRVPAAGPILIVANHESFWDPPLVGVAVRRRVAFMARKTLFNSKLLAWFMTRVGAFAVDQEGTGLEGIRTALRRLEEGDPVVIFPEGSRTRDGRLKPFMPGVALLVRKARVPVLPVGLAGAYDAWPIHARKPRFAPLWGPPRRGAIAAVVGQPIPAEALLAMEPRRMAEYLRERVGDLRAEAYRRKRLATEPG
jgi:1-acyl-sn-glycerol-3-phosphate acyltransferase